MIRIGESRHEGGESGVQGKLGDEIGTTGPGRGASSTSQYRRIAGPLSSRHDYADEPGRQVAKHYVLMLRDS